MAEHRIRLRGGWEWHDEGSGLVRRVDLPIDWPAEATSPVRLVRKFGRPRHDPDVESVRLEMLEIPGLVAASLNGRRLDDVPIAIDGLLLPRNELVLDVHFGGGPIPAWGSIALVMVPR